MAYAWGSVCFRAWDDCVERLARLSLWASWPPALQALFHAIYPAYLVMKAAKRLSASDDPVARRFLGVLAAACLIGGMHGSRRIKG